MRDHARQKVKNPRVLDGEAGELKRIETGHPLIHRREEVDLKTAQPVPGKAIHTPLLASEHMPSSPSPPDNMVDKFTGDIFRRNAYDGSY